MIAIVVVVGCGDDGPSREVDAAGLDARVTDVATPPIDSRVVDDVSTPRPDASMPREDAGGGEPDASAPCAPADRDGDGHDAIACGGDDCDDGDPAIHPGAFERDVEVALLGGIPGSEGDELAAEVDAMGDLHVAYHWSNEARSVEALRYARVDVRGERVVDEEAHRMSTDSRGGRDAALALDAMGAPWVSFVDQMSSGFITFFAGTRGGDGAWTFETPSGGNQQTSIALASDGSAHVAVGGVAHLARTPAGNWSDEPVATGRSPRILVAPDDSLHVVFATNDAILHATRDAGGWSAEPIESFAVGVSPYPGLVARIDAAGAIHVAYGTGTELVYAHREASPGAGWARETIAASPDVPQSILPLADGRIGVAFITFVDTAGYTIRFAFRSATDPEWTLADGPACGCYDVEIVERGGAITAVFGAGGNLALGTFTAPDGEDTDCDGSTW